MITNIIITLYEFNSKVERQFISFTGSVRCQQEYVWLLKGNRKGSEKEKCVLERTLA